MLDRAEQLKNAKSIKKFPHSSYHCNLQWPFVEKWIEENNPDLNPDFQRVHVWTRPQQVAYIEYCLMEGIYGQDIFFNCPGWCGRSKVQGPLVLVDGKQRLEAIRAFMRKDFKAHGFFIDQIILSHKTNVSINISELETRREVLEWYLSINRGGTPHTDEEINKVKDMLAKEQNEKLN